MRMWRDDEGGGEVERGCFVSQIRIRTLVLKFRWGHLSYTRLRQEKRLSTHQIVGKRKRIGSYSVSDIIFNEISDHYHT